MVLGTSAGGATIYVEPPAAVSLNNELVGARGECYAAEEAVLWVMTGRLMDLQDQMDHMFEVGWLHGMVL
jgi:dsDNA-specific endonuclease/ATPase MutS2